MPYQGGWGALGVLALLGVATNYTGKLIIKCQESVCEPDWNESVRGGVYPRPRMFWRRKPKSTRLHPLHPRIEVPNNAAIPCLFCRTLAPPLGNAALSRPTKTSGSSRSAPQGETSSPLCFTRSCSAHVAYSSSWKVNKMLLWVATRIPSCSYAPLQRET